MSESCKTSLEFEANEKLGQASYLKARHANSLIFQPGNHVFDNYRVASKIRNHNSRFLDKNHVFPGT